MASSLAWFCDEYGSLDRIFEDQASYVSDWGKKSLIIHSDSTGNFLIHLVVKKSLIMHSYSIVCYFSFLQTLEDSWLAPDFVLSILSFVPQQLLPSVGFKVFIQPLAIIWPNFSSMLLQHARSASALSALHMVGLTCGEALWIQSFHESILRGEDVSEMESPKTKSTPPASSPSFPAPDSTSAFVSAAGNGSTNDTLISMDVGSADSVLPAATAEETNKIPITIAESTATGELRLNEFGFSVDTVELCNFLYREFGLHEKERQPRVLKALIQGTTLLANELYSTDHHFLLELIQNADDNFYDESVIPRLRITLTDTSLEFSNNERGFRNQDVQSLSNLGGSTKKKGSTTTIGHKGIGFKSVFSETSRPQVHSRGFHFHFDSKDIELPFLLPRPVKVPEGWSEKNETKILLPFAEFPPSHSPIKDVSPYSRISQLLNQRCPAITLLFLHKLRQIEIKFEKSQRLTRMERIDGLPKAADGAPLELDPNSVMASPFSALPTEILERFQVTAKSSVSSLVTSTTSFDAITVKSQSFLLFSETIAVPEHIRNMMKEKYTRPDTVDLSIAFPWRNDRDVSQLEWQDLEVFAFLPVRSYGFPFVVQSSFDLTSSRESLDERMEWNKFLVSKLAKLIADAVLLTCFSIKNRILEKQRVISEAVSEEKKEAESLLGLDLALQAEEDFAPAKAGKSKAKKAKAESTALQLITSDRSAAAVDWLDEAAVFDFQEIFSKLPLPSRLQGALFRPVPQDLCSLLKDMPCIPSIQGQFLTPGNILFWPSSIDAFPKAAAEECQQEMNFLLQQLNLSLIHPRVSHGLSEESCKVLGIKTLSKELLLELLQRSCDAGDGSSGNESSASKPSNHSYGRLAWRVWVISLILSLPSSGSGGQLADLEKIAFVPLLNGPNVTAYGVNPCFFPNEQILPLVNGTGVESMLRVVDPIFSNWVAAFALEGRLSRQLVSCKSDRFYDVCIGKLRLPDLPIESYPILLSLALNIRKIVAPSSPLSKFANIHVLLSNETVKKAPLNEVHIWKGSEADLITSFIPASADKFLRIHPKYVKLLRDDLQVNNCLILFLIRISSYVLYDVTYFMCYMLLLMCCYLFHVYSNV